MKNFLYKITNLINQKVYVGVHSTDNINDGYMGSGKQIQAAIKKYGILNFKKEILEYFDTEDQMYLKEAQVVDINFVNDRTTYNMTLGGNKPPRNNLTGIKRSAETKQKIREANLGKKASEETKAKMVKSGGHRKGTSQLEETKTKIRNARVTQVFSQSTRKKMSDAKKGKSKPVTQCPHCSKVGGLPQMKQWHYDNCNNFKKEIEICA
jgi:group I intron endonuclease